MEITALYATLLGFLLLWISIETIRARQKNQVSLGFGKSDQVKSLASAHSNFVSYAPFFIVLLGLAEFQLKSYSAFLHVFGAIFVLGRLSHFLAFRSEKMNFKWRKRGMIMTFIPTFLVLLTLVALMVRSLVLKL